MRPFICLATSDERLKSYFGRLKGGILPRDARKQTGILGSPVEPTVAAWTPKEGNGSEELERFLLARARSHEVCMLVFDQTWQHHAERICHAVFLIPFDVDVARSNPQNYFFSVFAKALRNVAQLQAQFRRNDDRKLLSLPLRNFRAGELTEIARLCREASLSQAFSQDIEQQLVGLRERVRPRKKSTFKAKYAVDDSARFYEYGLELHSHFATGEPHLPSCELAGLFRFGIRVDERRHYNVSETEGDRTHIAGNFSDCHGAVHNVTERTHLNMFLNDYF